MLRLLSSPCVCSSSSCLHCKVLAFEHLALQFFHELSSFLLCFIRPQLLQLDKILQMLLRNKLLQPQTNRCLINQIIIEELEPILLLIDLREMVSILGNDVIDLKSFEQFESDHAMQISVFSISKKLDRNLVQLSKVRVLTGCRG